MDTSDFNRVGTWLNTVLANYNYQVAPTAPSGNPGKNDKSFREYRLQLINKANDTSESLIRDMAAILRKQIKNIALLQFNQISPNSSKFPSYSFKYDGQKFDLVIAKGANKGENFETQTVGELAKAFKSNKKSDSYKNLIDKLNESNPKFSNVEILKVSQRKGSTRKEGVPIERLGEIIGDIVLEDSVGDKWYISLKDVNGDTFSSYSGAATLFDATGTLQPNSPGAEFLKSFGVDLNLVQEGFDIRNNKRALRKKIPKPKADPTEIKEIFRRAWGMNYFYVKKTTTDWKVFWIDSKKLNALTSNIRVQDIQYPTRSSKQITIFCGNSEMNYKIELRNSKAGEYPNDTKFKVVK